jgi:hypothetical protein
MPESLYNWLLSSSEQERISFLAELAHDFTIVGRDFAWSGPAEARVKGLSGINEMQHLISQNIYRLADGTNKYAPSFLWQVLYGKAAQHGLSTCLEACLRWSASRRGLIHD